MIKTTISKAIMMTIGIVRNVKLRALKKLGSVNLLEKSGIQKTTTR